MANVTPEEEQRAYDVGTERGWDHANYEEAYGKEETPAPGEPSARQRMCPAWCAGYPLNNPYNKGWATGVRRYKSGRYADGTKIED